MGPGYVLWKLAFQLSPILLSGGIAQNMPGGVLPIIAITEAVNFVDGLLSGAANIELDQFFANFMPIPGSQLIVNQVGTYPLANQRVAGNAIIQQPTNLSMLMMCPAKNGLGYLTKLATMTALKQTLDQHIATGGMFIIATPSFIYTNGLLVNMTDVSNGESKQAQNAYQLDFTFPLITLDQAQQVQNSLIAQITNGNQVDATNGAVGWSGLGPTVGDPNSLAGGLVIPSGGGLSATTSPFIPPAGGLT